MAHIDGTGLIMHSTLFRKKKDDSTLKQQQVKKRFSHLRPEPRPLHSLIVYPAFLCTLRPLSYQKLFLHRLAGTLLHF